MIEAGAQCHDDEAASNGDERTNGGDMRGDKPEQESANNQDNACTSTC